ASLGSMCPSASTTASCSPTPDEYQGRSRNTRRPPPDRTLVLVLAKRSEDSVQPNVGTIQATRGGIGRAVLGTSRSSPGPSPGRLTGGATMATSTVAPSGMLLPLLALAMVPAASTTT